MKSPSARNRRETTSNGAAEFSFSTGAPYADKDEYLSKHLVFTIQAIEYQEEAGYEGGPRWAVTVSPSDGRPDEIITLQANPKRDDQLKAAKDHIAARGPIHNVRLTKPGTAYYFDTVGNTKGT